VAKSYPIFGQFNFKAQPGVAQMGRASKAVASFTMFTRRASAGARQMGRGMRQLSMAGAVVGAGFGWMIKKAAGFNKQMSAVRSVMRNASEKDFKNLRKAAMRMGATTSFTAIQAGQGLEQLARKGFNAAQAMAALSPVLRLAEADQMNLKQSSDIVSSAIRQFSLRARDATTVADTLAFVSANSGTNVLALGESLKFAGVTAAQAGQSVQATVGALGMLANIGVKGSLAGTALKNMFMRLGKQSKSFVKLFGTRGELKKALTDQTGKWRGMDVIMKEVIARIVKMKNQADQTKIAFELFGIRGKTALDAFRTAMKKSETGMTDFVKLGAKNIIAKSKGMATEMAKIRLDNLSGDFTILKSAVEGAAIGLGGMLVKSFNLRGGVKSLSGWIQKLSLAFGMMSEGARQGAVATKFGKSIAAVAFGIKEAIAGVKEAFTEVWAMVKKFFGSFTKGGSASIKTIVKIIAKVAIFGAVLAPIGIAFGGIAMVASGAFNVIGGGIKVVTALMSPWGLALMAILMLFGKTKKKGESTFGWLARTIKSIVSLFTPLIDAIKWLVKHLGVFGTLLGIGVAMKAGKAMFKGVASRMAKSKNPLARGLGKIMGGATAAGLPVRIVNWSEMPGGGMGGAGGGAGRLAKGGAAAGATGGAMAKIGAFMKGGGAGMSMGGGGAAAAAVGVGGFLLAMAPAIGGLLEMGRAYDPKEQKKTRQKYLSLLVAKMAKKKEVKFSELIRSPQEMAQRAREQRVRKFGGLVQPRAGMGQQWAQAQARGRGGGDTFQTEQMKKHTIGPLMQQMFRLVQAGRAADAKEIWTATGLGSLKQWAKYAGSSGEEAERLGLNTKMIATLGSLEEHIKAQRAGLERPIKVTVKVDGRAIAVATSKEILQTRERSGKPPAAGSRRSTAQRGF